MNHVRVHYNSDRPAQLQAHAYAQGSEIHIASGQEQHLPHEAWHVVQQAQGRVKPTLQLRSGISVNDDEGLEAEADQMGARALTIGPMVQMANGGSSAQVATSINHSGAAIQLEKSRYKPSSGGDKGAIDSYFDLFNTAVQKAFYYALYKPGLGDFADVQNGHLQHWREVWNSYLLGGQPQLPAAAFGYVVETLTELLYLPAPPTGMKAAPQQTRGGTRPDYILTKGGSDIAWIDITASSSAGHIENKVGWDAIDSFVEVTYPSVNLADIKNASKSKEAETFNPDLDIGAATERIKYAQKLRQFRKSWWRDLGEVLFPHPIAGSNELTRDQERRVEAIARLNKQYSLGLSADNQDHLRLAGSIIFIMGKSPLSWGILLSTSSAQGEAFLMDYDPNLKNIDAIFDQKLKEGSL